jgi:nucleotidyltransferase substrate binding protein (TIGR01987 family)
MDEINLDALEQSVAALDDGLQEYALYPVLIARDGVIQRFEVAMDVARQTVLRILKEVFFIEEAVARKDTFREAAKLGLIADAEAWIGYVNARNSTSHTYNSKKAQYVFAQVPAFLPDAYDLIKRLKPHVA